MITDKLKNLINELTARTISKNIIWQETSAENGYQTQLPSGSITVEKAIGNISDHVFLTVLNVKGMQVENLHLKFDEKDYDILDSLFTAINRSYLKSDEVLDNLFEEIKNPQKINKISDIFRGKWSNSYTIHNKITTEVFEIRDDNKYFISDIHWFNIEGFFWSNEERILKFIKVGIKPNDNRRLVTILNQINDKCFQGYENNSIPVVYTKIEI